MTLDKFEFFNKLNIPTVARRNGMVSAKGRLGNRDVERDAQWPDTLNSTGSAVAKA